MLQFKIITNKITYLTSVYLIKVKGGGGSRNAGNFAACIYLRSLNANTKWASFRNVSWESSNSFGTEGAFNKFFLHLLKNIEKFITKRFYLISSEKISIYNSIFNDIKTWSSWIINSSTIVKMKINWGWVKK